MSIRYPLALYRSGWTDLDDFVVVYTETEEVDARRDGYRMLSDPAPAATAEADADDDGDDDTPEAPRRRGRPRKAA